MQSGQAADLAIFLICIALLLGYNLFYFTVHSFKLPIVNTRFLNLFAVNRKSRKSWVLTLSKDAKEGINAVQTLRNQVLGVSILAATIAPIQAAIINVMTDAAKLQQVAEYSKIDPISSTPLLSPQVKLGIAFGILLVAVMAYVQSVRLTIHVGYTMRVVGADPAAHEGLSHLSVVLMKRASLYFAVGMRLFFAWGPFILWLLGPMSLLIATLLDVAAMFFLDLIPASYLEPEHEDREEEEQAAARESAEFLEQQEQLARSKQ